MTVSKQQSPSGAATPTSSTPIGAPNSRHGAFVCSAMGLAAPALQESVRVLSDSVLRVLEAVHRGPKSSLHVEMCSLVPRHAAFNRGTVYRQPRRSGYCAGTPTSRQARRVVLCGVLGTHAHVKPLTAKP